MHTDRLRPGRALPMLLVVALTQLGAQRSQPPIKPAEQPQSETATLPSARKVLDRHVEAIGGRAAVLARSSSHVTGTISLPSKGLTGTLELFAAKPDKSVQRITLPGVGTVDEGFDGTNGWSISAITGPTLLQGRELEQKKFDSYFYADLHDTDRYQSMTTVEQTTFDGRQCYKVRLVRRSGGEDFEFYDMQTGLKAGVMVTRETLMGAIPATVAESDYRRFGKLLQPTTLKQTVMGLQQLITITTLEYDNVDPSVFELPAAIKALVK
jgi:hypothetical protein